MAAPLLLLQARRADDAMLAAERASFAAACGVPVSEVDTWDLTQGPPSPERVRASRAILIGGAGEFYVSSGNLPQQDRTLEALVGIVQSAHPMFASCFGFQLLVAALGGEIVHDPENVEVGTFELKLNENGAADELLGTMPRRFHAQLGRKDRAGRLPPGVTPLASSARCGCQALRVDGALQWATQFHPELDRTTNLDRYFAYIDGYASVLDEDERARIEERFVESPEASTLLRTFLSLL